MTDEVEYSPQVAAELEKERESLNVRILLEQVRRLESIAIRQYTKLSQYKSANGLLNDQVVRVRAGEDRHRAYKKQHRELQRAHRLLVLEHKAAQGKIKYLKKALAEYGDPRSPLTLVAHNGA